MGAIARLRWFDARSRREGVTPSRPTPVFTLGLCLAAIAAYALGQGSAWEWSREALGRGEWHRLMSAHLAHWSLEHLAWDVGALAVLGGWLEGRGRARYVALVLMAALAISLGLSWLDPSLAAYRGLSGVDAALFVSVCGALAHDAVSRRDHGAAVVAGVLLLGFVAKIAFEAHSGASLFVARDPGPPGVVVAPIAHAIGAGVALGFGVLSVGVRRGFGGRLRF